MRREYARVGDLEVEGKLLLGDESLAACLVRAPDAPLASGGAPGAEEYRRCAELANELKEKLNALIGALT